MKIGITYDLRHEYLTAGYTEEETAEFDSIDTIDALVRALQALGHDPDRIGNVHQLAVRLVHGERWDLVFNMAEGLHGIGREAQVPALLDAFELSYTFSDPLVLALALHKGMTKHVVRSLGIPTPEFTIVDTREDLESVALPWPVIAKPVAEGTSKGISGTSKVSSPTALEAVCTALLNRFRQPVLVETFLSGRELTVGIVGTGTRARALGAMEVLLQAKAEPEIYSYANKVGYASRVRYALVSETLAEQAMDLALRVWRGLGCRDGGRVDLRCDAQGLPYFLEVNPLPGLNPDHSDLPILCRLLGLPYDALISSIVDSALQRRHTSVSGHGRTRKTPYTR
jgi:D-alanine-D-alanine ligase